MNDEDEKTAELLAQLITLLEKQKELLEKEKAFRPMKDGFVGMWQGEEWTDFHWAASEISDALAIPFGPATARLRQLCAAGDVRAVTSEDQDEPELILPSRWRAEEVDLAVPWDWMVAVCESDLRYWLNQQPVQPTAGGKQSRILRLLAKIHPTGVPNRADCPREQLKAELLAQDASLSPLDLKTLKTAIDAHNRHVGNTRNASVSD
jgi:hypothetical protein